MSFDMKPVYRAGAITVIVPVAAFLGIIASGSMLLLDYIHVLLGAIWTGVDVFFGLIFFFVIATLDTDTKAAISVRLLPMSLFFVPTASVLTPLAGYILAVRTGIFSLNTVFVAAIVIGSLLVGVGIFTIVLTAAMTLREASKKEPDTGNMSRLLMIGSHGALVQLTLQIAIISIMAYIVVYL